MTYGAIANGGKYPDELLDLGIDNQLLEFSVSSCEVFLWIIYWHEDNYLVIIRKGTKDECSNSPWTEAFSTSKSCIQFLSPALAVHFLALGLCSTIKLDFAVCRGKQVILLLWLHLIKGRALKLNLGLFQKCWHMAQLRCGGEGRNKRRESERKEESGTSQAEWHPTGETKLLPHPQENGKDKLSGCQGGGEESGSFCYQQAV